MNDLFISFGID